MASMAYKTTMFSVFFNYGMLAANFLGNIIFPDISTQVITANVSILKNTDVFTNFGSMDSILSIVLTAGVLALFAFSLLIPTIPFVFMFFGLNSIISLVYLNQLLPSDNGGFGSIIKGALMMGLTIVFYIGISEYAGRTKV